MLLNFVDRENELSGLNDLYQKERADLFVLYGRRRIGKTTLCKKFAEDKPHFYFLARVQDHALELERMKEVFSERFDTFIPDVKDIEGLFKEMLDKIDDKKKFVFIIDEFPYWIEEDRSILSEMQYIWDEILKDENIFLILTGSSVGMMESDVLDHKSPLYGRRTGQLKLTEIPVHKISEFLPKYSNEELIKTYGALGGVPFYLKEFDPEKDFFENIRDTFLNKLNILHEEAEILLREELRKPNIYFNIIKAMIDGATTLSEISSQSRVSITNVNKYLKVLERLEIIMREYPVTGSSKKKKFLYRITDNYFRFWLSFVYPYQGRIEENPDSVLMNIKSNYDRYMGPVFEEVCMDYIARHYQYQELGRWWYGDKEIDIVALDRNTIIFGECKWSKNKIGVSVLEDLKEKSKDVRWKNNSRKEKYILFSRSGFTKELIQHEHIELIDIMDIL